MVKLRALLTVFTFILKNEACDYGKGHYISDQNNDLLKASYNPFNKHNAKAIFILSINNQ